MKKALVFAVLLVASLACGTVAAKTLEEVLKEKGVITEADYREVTREKPLDYKLGKGFTFNSSDGKFQLSLGGRLQARYTFVDKDDANGPAQDVGEWRIRRMKLYLSGHAYNKDLTYRVQAALENGGNAKLLDDAYFSYRFVDEAQLQAGQFKTPFAREELTSAGALEFVDRANAVDAFKPTRDIGAMLHGRVAQGRLTYNAGIFGGTGQSNPRTTNNAMFVARITANPLGEVKYGEGDPERSKKPLVSIGANYFANTLKRSATGVFESTVPNYVSSTGWLGKGAAAFDNTEKVDIDSFGVDAAFKWMGLFLQGEYLGGEAEGKKTGKTLKARGFYAQAGYFVLPRRVEVAARYSYVDPNRDRTQDLQAETQGAVSCYFHGHRLTVQGDYTNIHTQVPGKSSTDDKQVRLQAQVEF
ncbi:MAG: porin [Deltaproteobacteria bacterium]|nr:porin [Deltaproteobacteria bacterium]